MDILDIVNQPLSSLLLDFFMCPACKTVDRDKNRALVGYECPVCGNPSEGAHIYFSLSVISLVDLMQDYFHLGKNSSMTPSENANKHQLAVVIFFCTLGEVLLEDFLVECMANQGVSRQVQKRLLDDNLFAKQRIDKLFPLFTDVSWNEAIRYLDETPDLDYQETVKFYLQAVEKRNRILHKGNIWAMPSDMPEQCIRSLWPLVSLFVALHNEHSRAL